MARHRPTTRVTYRTAARRIRYRASMTVDVVSVPVSVPTPMTRRQNSYTLSGSRNGATIHCSPGLSTNAGFCSGTLPEPEASESPGNLDHPWEGG